MTSSTQWPEVSIGQPAGDHITIKALGRMHPDATDFWDGNWLNTLIVVSAGKFRAEVGASLRSDELAGFREGLQRIYAELRGTASLSSMEEWLSVDVAIESFGKLKVVGRLTDALGGGNKLSFKIDDLDQSYLPEIIDALQEIEIRYPVVGSP